MKKTPVFIVPHTHWDREWYTTETDFRAFLCEALDNVLHLLETHDEYKFTLDGQVRPLLDYLEVKPEKLEKIKKYVEIGRLCIGPWLTQPDEFLVSGESLIRNLLLGIAAAQMFGRAMLHGYIPDAFGHIAQLPQILRGFDIQTAFVMRGAEKAAEMHGTNEFLWEAPDGSRVFCHVLETGYCNAADLEANPNELPKGVKWLRDRLMIQGNHSILDAFLQFLARRSQTKAALLLHGCDHRGPSEKIFTTVDELSKIFPHYQFIIATLEDYGTILNSVNKCLPVISGELRQCKYHPILSGVLSTRIYLKQMNAETEILLEKYAEPIAALAMLNGANFNSLLKRTWHVLLQNHAHDSICGTGVDEVHHEMMIRFSQAQKLARFVINAGLERFKQIMAAENSDEASIIVFNPCPWPVTAEVEIFIKDAKATCVQTLEGNTIPLTSIKHEIVVSNENILSGVQTIYKEKRSFQDIFPPFGIKTYKLSKANVNRMATKVKISKNIIENEFYKLQIRDNGSFNLLDKENGLEFHKIHIFEDAADRGDEYNFDALPNERPITSLGLKGAIVARQPAPWKAELEATIGLVVPLSLTQERRRRSKRKVLLPIHVKLALQAGVKRVDIHTKLTNKARDHRLRVFFPTGWEKPNIVVDKTFAVLNHTLNSADEGWIIEQPATTFPQKLFVALEKNGAGFAVINRGLPECEVTEDGKIYLTLLRAVGWLSREDLYTRKGHAGPPLTTPGAQCLGVHVYNYALYTYTGTWHSSGLLRSAYAFLCPPIGIQLNGLTLGQKSFIAVDREEIVMSACKPSEDGHGIIVRLYNPCGKTLRARLYVQWPIREAWLARLDETCAVPIKMNENYIDLEFKGFEIKTLKFIVPLHTHKAHL